MRVSYLIRRGYFAADKCIEEIYISSLTRSSSLRRPYIKVDQQRTAVTEGSIVMQGISAGIQKDTKAR
jgi:hypothetical protein